MNKSSHNSLPNEEVDIVDVCGTLEILLGFLIRELMCSMHNLLITSGFTLNLVFREAQRIIVNIHDGRVER